jgi:hypothetical protein
MRNMVKKIYYLGLKGRGRYASCHGGNPGMLTDILSVCGQSMRML